VGLEPTLMKTHRKWLRRMVKPAVLSRINNLSHIEDRLFDLEARRAQLAEIALRPQFGSLFAGGADCEFQIFSQNGEDGILLSLLNQTGARVKTFVEIGIENGLECNTALLAFVLGWDGLMVEADPLGAAAAQRLVGRVLRRRTNRVEVRQAFVTRENINDFVGGPELGVLSIDVDGVDYWLWKAVTRAAPEVVIAEYNASMGPVEPITVPYTAAFTVAESQPYYHGASLAALEKLGREKGYALVAVDAAGVNAFFVRETFRTAALPARTAAELFRPHRIRLGVHTQEEQWNLIRHLPYERV
jgi:hypothetical protein